MEESTREQRCGSLPVVDPLVGLTLEYNWSQIPVEPLEWTALKQGEIVMAESSAAAGSGVGDEAAHGCALK